MGYKTAYLRWGYCMVKIAQSWFQPFLADPPCDRRMIAHTALNAYAGVRWKTDAKTVM